MRRISMFMAIALFITVIAMGCSGGAKNPLSNPLSSGQFTNQVSDQTATVPSQTNIWGYYDVYVDIASQTANATLNRNVMYSSNVTEFLNGNAASLQFVVNATPMTPDGTAVDVDIDVQLTHPIPGNEAYNGYDVRGIFIGNGSSSMAYNGNLKYAAYGTDDQVMYDYNLTGEDTTTGNPDGYTRWWNPTEFVTPGLFGYTKGTYVPPKFNPTANLNPYKYFADGLASDGNVYDFLNATTDHGVFRSGSTNTRNYYLRFPVADGISFAYAVVADWKSVTEHPANAPEAVAISCQVAPELYFVSSDDNGGDLKLDVSIFDWDSTISVDKMEDYRIIIDSTVLSAPYVSTPADMTPVGGEGFVSTYSFDIPADHITSATNQQYWVIVEEQNKTYESEFGVPNNCGTDKLAAFFRNDLFVSSTAFNYIPVFESGVTGNDSPRLGSTETYSVVASDPDPMDTLTYMWTLTNTEDGSIVDGFNEVPGNPPGHLTINWSTVPGAAHDKQYDLSCSATDGHSDPVPAPVVMTITMGNNDPIIYAGVTGTSDPTMALTITYYTVAADPDGDPLTYSWTMKNHLDQSIVTGYDGIPGAPPGQLTIDWGTVPGVAVGSQYDLSCTVTDGKCMPIEAPVVLLITIMNQDPIVNSGVTGFQDPTMVQTLDYNVDASDPDGETLTYSWTLKDHSTQSIISGYNGIPGAPAGQLTIDWGSIPGVAVDNQYDLSCTVSDGHIDVPAPVILLITIANQSPIVNSGVTGNQNPTIAQTLDYNVDASDPDGETLGYSWTMKNHSTQVVITGYNGIPGSPAGQLSIDWSTVPGVAVGNEYDLSCIVTDGHSYVPAPVILLITIANQTPTASFTIDSYPAYDWNSVSITCHAGSSSDPDTGETATLTYSWDFNNDGVYGSTGDTIDSGTSIDPVHIYTDDVNFPVRLKVTDIHGAYDTMSSSNVVIAIPSCGTMTLPASFVWSTSQNINNASFLDTNIAPMTTKAAATPRIIFPYGTTRFGAVNADTYGSATNSGNNSGGNIFCGVINSSDRIIYTDNGSDRQLYYTDFNGSFGSMHNSFGNQLPSGPDDHAYRMAITSSNEPIVLIGYSNTPRIYIGNSTGTNWGSAISLPTEIRTAIGGSWANYTPYINDMDYDPESDSILIATSYNGNEGLFAISRTGVLRWRITDIWTTKSGTYRLGIEVPKANSECRIVVFRGDNNTGTDCGIARVNTNGGELVSTNYSGTYDITRGYAACLIPPVGSVSTWRFWGGATGYGNNYYAYLNLPSGF